MTKGKTTPKTSTPPHHVDRLQPEEVQKTEEKSSFLVTMLLTNVFLTIMAIAAVSGVYVWMHRTDTPVDRFVAQYSDKKALSVGAVAAVFALTLISKLPVFPALAALPNWSVMSVNAAPRLAQSQLRGFGGRALGGHLNAIEAFPPFAAAVILAWMAPSPPALLIAKVSVSFVLLRVVYHIVYLIGFFSPLRSWVWLMGFLLVASLFALPYYPSLFHSSPDLLLQQLSTVALQTWHRLLR